MHNLKITDVRANPGDSAFLINDGITAILYDSGFAFTGYAVADNIKSALGERTLDYIFLTHSHYDHALGSVYAKKYWPSAKVVAGEYATKIFAITLFIGFVLTCFYEVNFTLGIMGFMLFFSATASHREAVYEKLSIVEMVTNKKVRWGIMSVPFEMPLYEVRRFHTKNQVTIFNVINKDGLVDFSFSELDLERVITYMNQDQAVGEVKYHLKMHMNRGISR